MLIWHLERISIACAGSTTGDTGITGMKKVSNNPFLYPVIPVSPVVSQSLPYIILKSEGNAEIR